MSPVCTVSRAKVEAMELICGFLDREVADNMVSVLADAMLIRPNLVTKGFAVACDDLMHSPFFQSGVLQNEWMIVQSMLILNDPRLDNLPHGSVNRYQVMRLLMDQFIVNMNDLVAVVECVNMAARILVDKMEYDSVTRTLMMATWALVQAGAPSSSIDALVAMVGPDRTREAMLRMFGMEQAWNESGKANPYMPFARRFTRLMEMLVDGIPFPVAVGVV